MPGSLPLMPRATSWWPSLEAWRRDLRHGARLLARTPGFTLVAIVSLGLGIGANSAVFSLLDAAVLRPVPYDEGDRLMALQLRAPRPGSGGASSWSYPKFQELAGRVRTFETLAGFAGTDVNVADRVGDLASAPVRLHGELVSAAYLRTLRVTPILGRDFLPEEDRAASAPVALIAEGLWRQQFGGDRGLLDRALAVNGLPVRVVGILPGGFRGESGRAELWMPLATAPLVTGRAHALTERGAHWFNVIGRLRPDVAPAQADAEVRLVVAGIEQGSPAPPVPSPGGAMRLADSKVEPLVRRALLVLLAAVALVLLIACLNLGSLLLARAMARQREIAVRLALGASRGAVVRQFLAESLLIAALGGVAGLLMARGLLGLVRWVQPPPTWEGAPFLRGLDFRLAQINGVVVLFAVLVTLLTLIVFGVGPAWHAARGDLQHGLKADPRTGGGTPVGRTEGAWRLGAWILGQWNVGARSLLVVAQLACTLVLVVAAGLLIRSFAELVQTSTGIDPTDVLTFRLDMPARPAAPAAAAVPSGTTPVTRGAGAIAPAARVEAPPPSPFEALTARLAALPGVASIALADTLPVTRPRQTTAGTIDGVTEMPDLPVFVVSPGYFDTFGVPVRQGRAFESGDRLGSPRVALISETAARRYWPGGDPIGHRVTLRLNGWSAPHEAAEIVGVVGDVRYGRLDEPIRPVLYLTAGQRLSSSMYVAIRARTDPAALAAPVRHEVARFDASLPVYDVQTMTQRVAAASARPRFQGVLMGMFAGLALLLAAVGVSGVMAYTVMLRTRELGVRLALGADRRDISRLVARQALGLAALALALGLPLAFASTRVLRGLLFGVTPADPATFALAASVLVGVALIACWRPAYRAGRIDPIVALRHD